MNMRLVRSKQSGQSIPLIALMIVVLLSLVALSVDVGNTYAQQRSLTRSTNAAVLAAMDELIRNGSDEKIAQVIRESYAANGITIVDSPDQVASPNQRYVKATYVDNDGNDMNACTIGNCTVVPDRVRYIHIIADGTVETDFARVVGRPTLPVNAQSWAMRCPPTNGVYPIAINQDDLLVDNFEKPEPMTKNDLYIGYADANYPASVGKMTRRIFLKSGSVPGSFGWLRWNNDPKDKLNSSDGLADMLAGDGNLDTIAFKEADWPSLPDPKPKGYPLSPGQLTNGDWVWANPGFSAGKDVDDAIWDHIAKRTVLILPIVGRTAGSGSGASYEVVDMGSFYVVDPTPGDGRTTGGFVQQGGGNAYLDLVYLGPVKYTACLQTNMVPPGDTTLFGVKAEVRVMPSYRKGTQPNLPVAYTIVLDVSGSMSQDFAGHATIGASHTKEANSTGGTDYQCGTRAPIAGDPITWDPNCQSGANNGVWRKYQERRIFIAKNAIYQFINQMSSYDRMKLIAFSSGNGEIGGNNAKVYGSWTMTSKADFIKTVKDAGTWNSDPYRTAGGTPGAQALRATRAELAKNDVPKVDSRGLAYRRVVIYITDGLANVNLGGTTNYNDGDNVCQSVNRNARLSTPECQVGYYNDGPNPRPIRAMINEAEDMRKADPNLVIYTMALAADANSAKTGLGAVANDSNKSFIATDPNAVSAILTDIFKDVNEGDCLSNRAPGYVERVDPQNVPNPAEVGTALPANGYGWVYIYPAQGATTVPLKKLPIQHDPMTGKLSIDLPKDQGLPGGEYTMQAFVAYKTVAGPTGDGKTYTYRWLMPVTNAGGVDDEIGNGGLSRSFTLSSGQTLSQVIAQERINLVMEPTVDVCKLP